MLGQHGADRLDTPPQTTGLTPISVSPDEVHNQPCGRSSSAAKKAEAAFRIEFARFNSAFSRFSRRTCSDSSLLSPARAPASTSPWRTHCRTVSPELTPNSPAIRRIADHSDSSGDRSATIRTARCFNSNGYRFVDFPDMTPTFPRFEVSGHAGAIQETAVLVAWADEQTIVTTTSAGRLATSDDAGTTWTLHPDTIGTADSLFAERTTDGKVEIIVVVDGKVLRTTDAGATTEVVVQ